LKAPDEGDEERLRIEAAQRDPARFAELYEAHFERVYAYVARRVRDRAAAEDVTSDVFHQALAHLDRFEWRGVPFAAWLFRIAANAIADRWKRISREHPLPAPDPEPTVDPASERLEERASLFRLVARLPEDQRRVVAMRFGEEKTTREIARALGRSEGAVKQLQFRALQGLRAAMGQAND
jgi:RNA polymerase sigma-70 factor (ECF subfamily)